MKCFSVLLFVAFIALAHSKGITDEQKAKLKEFKKECIAESHVDEAILKKAKVDGEFTDDEKLKEFFVCLFKKIEIFDKDGKLDKKNFKEVLFKKYEDDVAEKVYEACVNTEKDDAKESAFEMAKCYHVHAPHINLD